jgi:hypothetical protein
MGHDKTEGISIIDDLTKTFQNSKDDKEFYNITIPSRSVYP